MRAQVCNDASLTLPEGAHQVPNQGEESREETEAGGRCVLEGGGPWAEHRVSPSQLDACNQETGPFLLWPDPFASVKKASIRCDQGLEVQGVMTFLGIFLEEIKRLDMVMEDHLRNSINLQKRNEVDPPRRIRLISSLSRAPGQRSSVLTGMGETSRGPWAPTGRCALGNNSDTARGREDRIPVWRSSLHGSHRSWFCCDHRGGGVALTVHLMSLKASVTLPGHPQRTQFF
ncbi:uncharacterized protein LOC129145967 isoform X2 [Talpa occidentalis]|uniref:uncharacterized protein LOC129145967 isoform X2 n=1 Tax=Talpa occidentalis TaxID=50954 RepID=UPI0023F6CD03|nr:uncharacterized protein LOC129145967 isoform X2 [Talpa occidentalis]